MNLEALAKATQIAAAVSSIALARRRARSERLRRRWIGGPLRLAGERGDSYARVVTTAKSPHERSLPAKRRARIFGRVHRPRQKDLSNSPTSAKGSHSAFRVRIALPKRVRVRRLARP